MTIKMKPPGYEFKPPCLVHLIPRLEKVPNRYSTVECVLLRYELATLGKNSYFGFVTSTDGEDRLRSIQRMYLPTGEYELVRQLSDEEVTLLMLKHTR